jgi:hypothetical protein
MGADGEVVIVFMPALAPLLLRAEHLKGGPLTEDEVCRIRDNAFCLTTTPESAAAIDAERGYRDIDPENAWQEWQQLRPTLAKGEQPPK